VDKPAVFTAEKIARFRAELCDRRAPARTSPAAVGTPPGVVATAEAKEAVPAP
jgi:precorrin isomerase